MPSNSFKMEGVVCVPCVLFAPAEVPNDRGKITEISSFVVRPFRKYEKISERLAAHRVNKYHMSAQERADAFLKLSQTPGINIVNKLDDTYLQQVIGNRKRLVPILKTIILCGRLGIALRGHRDYGVIDLRSAIKGNEGNFRALLAFRVESGDRTLEAHLSTGRRKATYISKAVQNELIQLCGVEISKEIVKEVKAARYFSIIADETSDSSQTEQLCICIRYGNEGRDITLKEEFMGFVGMNDLSARSVASHILAKLAELDLDVRNCVGQGYDGAASMSGHVSGVQVLIREQAPLAVYVHCASHCLNLVLNHASQVPPIRNMFTIFSDVITFFNDSPKRRHMLDANLVTLCETRFIQRHDAILRFSDNFSSIIGALQDITESNTMDAKTKAKAITLINGVSTSSFLVSLAAAMKVMSLTMNLSRLLQSPKLDLPEGSAMIDSINKRLREWRGDDSAWHGVPFSVFTQAEQLAEIAGIEIAKPRIVGRQQHRASATSVTESHIDYFKRSIWLPYIDAVIMQMQDKFSRTSQTAFLLPSVLTGKEIDMESFQKVFDMYGVFIGCYKEQLYLELLDFLAYKESAESCQSGPQVTAQLASPSILDVLANASKRFVNIRHLLRIAATLPLTSCSAERCFSAMKILKTRLRSTMSDERLSGLAMVYIHKDTDISIESVINNFSLANRKLDFVL